MTPCLTTFYKLSKDEEGERSEMRNSCTIRRAFEKEF